MISTTTLLSLGKGRPYDNHLVRTDPQTRKITSIFTSQTRNAVDDENGASEYEIVPKDRVPIKLGSVRELREELVADVHNGMTVHYVQ